MTKSKEKRILYRTLPDRVATKTLLVRLTPEALAWLRGESRKRKVSMNSLILDFILLQMEAEGSPSYAWLNKNHP